MLQTNGVIKSNVKVDIKKPLQNAPKRKGGEKVQIMQMIGLIRPMLIKIWNSIVGITFYVLILGHHELIFSYTQARNYLKF